MRGDNNRPLKDWLKIFSQEPHIRSRLYQTRIEKMWLELMGPVINGYTRKIKLDGQVLTLYVDSSPLKAELSTMKETIMTSVNQRLGENFVKEVRIF
jgi:predicted nucleic acid-binding Zn ribbon protein